MGVQREWRLVYDEGDVEESLPDVDISAIIFELKMPQSHKEIIRKVTSDIVQHQISSSRQSALSILVEELKMYKIYLWVN